MKILFKKNVLDKNTKKYFPLNKEIYFTKERFTKLKESVKSFGKEKDYFEVVEEEK